MATQPRFMTLEKKVPAEWKKAPMEVTATYFKNVFYTVLYTTCTHKGGNNKVQAACVKAYGTYM